MEQNEPQKNAAGNSCAPSDRRTFLIAFLTTVILLALYHFGTGLFAIFSGKCESCTIPVAREYVLVPVSSMHQPCMGMMGRKPGGFHRGGFHRGERDGEHHGGMPRFGKRGENDGKHGGMHHFGKRGAGMPHHDGMRGHHPDAPVPPTPAAPATPAEPAAAPEGLNK